LPPRLAQELRAERESEGGRRLVRTRSRWSEKSFFLAPLSVGEIESGLAGRDGVV